MSLSSKGKEAGYNPAQNQKRSWIAFLGHIPLVWAISATLLIVFNWWCPKEYLKLALPGHSTNSGKRNVIFMVSDGMGPASVALARNFFQHTEDKGLSPIALDNYFVGNSRTQSSDSYVTDSAAGATAFSCCLKTYNGAIGVDPDGQPCATILEAAKLAGYRTGLVVTTRITDATPASFASHAHYRSEEDFIAEQLVNWNGTHPLGSMVDLLMGGGRCHFLPSKTPGSCRRDDRDLIADAVSEGWSYVDEMNQFRDLDMGKNVSLPLLGLFAPTDLPFSVDYHDDSLPRLNETALTAVKALAEATKDSDQGFFLMVEGSRIDHAGHANDPGAQVREVLTYSETFEALAHFVENANVPTILVSTSDHETGGLSVSRQVTRQYPDYLWYPEVLARAKHSTEFLSRKLRAFHKLRGAYETESETGSEANLETDLETESEIERKTGPVQGESSGGKHKRKDKALDKFIKKEILGDNGLGLDDYTNEDVRYLAHHRGNAQDYLSQLLSVRAQVGWSTHGHSAVDVNVYATASDKALLDPIRGGNENIEVGHFMREFLNISQNSLESLTVDLKKKFKHNFALVE